MVNSISHNEVRKITISVIYRKNVYVVTLIHDRRALEKASIIEITYDERYSEFPKVSRVGYTLDGWYTTDDGK